MRTTKAKKRLDTRKQKRKLLEELERIQEELQRIAERRSRRQPMSIAWDSSDYGDQPGDSVGETFERERDLAVEDSLQEQRERVKEALAKIENKTYGTCDRCGVRIGVARLEALPWATFCIECQSRLDRR